jgi:hypothetical protein
MGIGVGEGEVAGVDSGVVAGVVLGVPLDGGGSEPGLVFPLDSLPSSVRLAPASVTYTTENVDGVLEFCSGSQLHGRRSSNTTSRVT